MRNRSRPVLQLPRTPLETLLEALTVLGLIAVIAMTVWGYSVLPAIIPTHYGLSGAPNAYGGKASLLILPILSVILPELQLGPRTKYMAHLVIHSLRESLAVFLSAPVHQ